VLQVNQAGQMLHSGGQQIMVHAVPQGAQTIQVATQSGQALQQIQVVPVSSLQVRELLCTGQKYSSFLHLSLAAVIQCRRLLVKLIYVTHPFAVAHTGNILGIVNSRFIWQHFKLLI
jgi:hypothetical protein